MANNLIPFSNEHFVKILLELVELGSPYWYGTCMYRCKDSTLKSKTKQYPKHYTSGRMAKYREDIAAKRIAADCVGAIKGYCWTGGGESLIEAFGNNKAFENHYNTHGCPDYSANKTFEHAKAQGMPWGSIDTLPELPGLCVRYDGHVGVYVGGGIVAEWRGFRFGSVKTRLDDPDRPWTHWYQHPAITYADVPMLPAATELGARLLKLTDPHMKGDDVEMLQELLMQLGYELPEYGADGDFGEETEKAVVAFQLKAGLEVDGIYGAKSHAALMDAVADKDVGQADQDEAEPEEVPQAPAEPQPEEPRPEVPAAKPAALLVEIVSKGGNVNIRSGNGAQYGRITSVKPGKRFAYVATGVNGWHAIQINSQIGWVSGEYSRIVDDNPPEDTPPEDSGKVKAIADISRWQGDIDFEKLAPEVEFVIARGMFNVIKDVYFDKYAAGMKRLGIPFGVYQYTVEETADGARSEARIFHAAMSEHNPLFYVLDAEYEGISHDTIRAWAEEMRALGVKKLGCYVAHNRYDDYNFGDLRGLFDFVWIPRYGSNDGTVEGSKRPAYACDLWQYTSKGTLPGIKGDVDLNMLVGDKSAKWFKER